MCNKSKDIRQLIGEILQFLRDQKLSTVRIETHRKRWNRGIVPYMDNHRISQYTPAIGETYLSKIAKCFEPSTLGEYNRSIRMLDEYLLYGSIQSKIKKTEKYQLRGEVGAFALEFIAEKREARRSASTLLEHQRQLSYFISGLHIKGIDRISDITERDILDFIDSSPYCKVTRYNTIRQFSQFLFKKGLTAVDLSYVVGRMNYPHQEKLPSVYSAEEVQKIEQSVDQTSDMGKRDYALLLLASRLGLRASDIVRLTFDNLDWDNNQITLTQYKTGNPIVLPLLREVGEAIINYLRFSRPKSDSPNIFLSVSAPYKPMSQYGLSSAISRIIASSGVQRNGRRFGPHALRHSLASNLLKIGTSIPVISSALGHSNSQTTMMYLRVDIENLRKCAIEVPAVPDSFYEQKGGKFYK